MKNKLIIVLTITTIICTACGKATQTENKNSNATTETTRAENKENNGEGEQQFQIMSKQIAQAFEKDPDEYCKYVNGEKKKVTAREYNPQEIEKEYFQGMKKKKVKISWEKFKKKSKEESVVELLKASYEKFQLD